MEQLKNMIRDAANEFQCHNFDASLLIYQRCMEKCMGLSQPKCVLNNLKSSVAALHTTLGNHSQAQRLLSQVLNEDKQHWLSLMRRSQLYKKKYQFKKALKDLDVVGMFAPDNLEIAALKCEIKGLLAKTNQVQSEEEKSLEDDFDEYEMLNFTNLKKIDRTSFSSLLPKSRESQVTLLGDKTFEYLATDELEGSKAEKYTPKFARQKFLEITQQLGQQVLKQSIEKTPLIKTSSSTRNKSILKNRDSELFLSNATENTRDRDDSGQKLISKIQDVDGKLIKAEGKEVNFRKSVSNERKKIEKQVKPSGFQPKKRNQRKSCLKKSSFLVNFQETNQKEKRKSRFQEVKQDSIDGKMILSEEPKSADKIESDDEGNQYNIFGNKKIQISQEVRENLGLGSDDTIIIKKNPKKQGRGKSILKTAEKKKVSIMVQEEPKKGKKSVMFKN